MAISNAQRQRIRGLHQRKFRKKLSVFLVEGRVNVLEVLASPLKVLELYLTADCIAQHFEFDLHLKSDENLKVFTIGDTELGRLSLQKNPDGVIAVVAMPNYSLDQTQGLSKVLLLDGVADPGNCGTLIRTAEWFGIQAILSFPGTVEWYNPKLVAAARGSLFRLKHWSLEPQDLQEYFSQHQVVVADLDGSNYKTFDWSKQTVLAIGNESKGPSEALLNLSPTKITIPKNPSISTESLNAAVAGAILLASMK